jgi:hypothetical protein
LDQLQPVRENTDPLNVQLGNPALRQEFVHNLEFGVSDYKVLSERSIYFFGRATFNDNAISTSTIVDAGKTTTQPINVDGTFNIGFNAGTYFKIKKPGLYFSFWGDMNVGRFRNKLNLLDNVNDNKNFNLSFDLSKRKEDKYSFSVRQTVGYTFSKSSLRPDIQTKFLSTQTEFDAWIKLPLKFEFNTHGNIYLRQKTDAFDRNNNYTKWDASLEKKLLKNNNLALRIAVNDILNQNIGFQRNATTNIITENRFLTLQRYWLVGIQYNISKNP